MSETTHQETERESWREEYERNVLNSAEENHIWLNAFSCIRPTDEFAMQIGHQVLAYVNNAECSHTSPSGYLLKLPHCKEVIIRVNKS